MEVEMEGFEGGLVAALPIAIPPTLSLDVLQAILSSCGASVNHDQLQAPTSHIIVQVYTALLSIPALRETISQLEVARSQDGRRNVDLEMQLHESEKLKDEAEKRAEEDRIAKETSIQEKNEMSSQLAEVKGTLESLQSNSESGSRQSAEVKGQLEKIQQEKRDILELLEREKLESARRAGEYNQV
jgi:nucleoprotein TPR